MVSEVDLELPRIIAQAQTGDSGAFGELYAKYAGLILRYLYVRVRDQEGAQDLTQEVFVRVIKGIGGFEYRGEKSFLGWLYTIANNVLIGQARRKRAISTPLDDSIEIVDPRSQEAVLSIYDRVALQQLDGVLHGRALQHRDGRAGHDLAHQHPNHSFASCPVTLSLRRPKRPGQGPWGFRQGPNGPAQ